MQKITDNVYVETEFPGCNTSFVVTAEGVVVIDTPMVPTLAKKWAAEAAGRGEIRYVINGEPHTDHVAGNCWFGGKVIAHEGTRRILLDARREELEGMLKRMVPDAFPLDKEFRYQPPDITFSHGLTLYLGDHTFQLRHMPGHTPFEVAVYVPELEGVVTQVKGLAYDIKPDGATFEPPLILECCYYPEDIPEGIAEEDLVLAYYDEEAGEWVILECTVHPEKNTITALISHLTAFARLGYGITPEPAAFSPGPLDISPTEVDIGEVTESPAPTEEAPVVPAAVPVVPAEEANWPLVGGIIGGVVVVGLLYFFLIRRRGQQQQQE